MVRLKLFLGLLSLIIFAVGAVAFALWMKRFVQPERDVEKKIQSTSTSKKDLPEPPDFGAREFDKAVEFLKKEELMAAREQLFYLLDYFPDSKTIPEAKRILGELHTDLLLSPIPMEGKGEYTVKRGDALAAIARHHDTTIDYIMRASGRTDMLIHPGDRLIVFPLDFEMRIELSNRFIVLEKDGRFFKQYAILQNKLPAQVKLPVKSEISSKGAWHNGRSVTVGNQNYQGSDKQIRTGVLGVVIKAFRGDAPSPEPEVPGAGDDASSGSASEEEDDDDDDDYATSFSEYGILVDQGDLEEMFTILRTGTPVRVVE